MTSAPYRLRPIILVGEENDLPFLRTLYASTRQEEMALSGWTQEQIEEFLFQQFEAQHRYYQENISTADFDLLLTGDGARMGRLYLDERPEDLRIVDIALLPEYRGQGIGRTILQDIIDRAFSLEKGVSIHVEQYNPAMKLYLRLGFRMVEEQGVYHLMEILPPKQSPSSHESIR